MRNVLLIVVALIAGGAGFLVGGRGPDLKADLARLQAELEAERRERKKAESMPSAVQMAQAMRARCPKTEGAEGAVPRRYAPDAGAPRDGGGSLDGEELTMAAGAMKLAGSTVRQKAIDDLKLSDKQIADLDAAAAAMNTRVQGAIDKLVELAKGGEPRTRDLLAATIEGLTAIQTADQAYLGLLDAGQKEKGSEFDVATQIDPVPLLDRLRKMDGLFGGGADGEPGKHQITIGAEIKTNEPAGK